MTMTSCNQLILLQPLCMHAPCLSEKSSQQEIKISKTEHRHTYSITQANSKPVIHKCSSQGSVWKLQIRLLKILSYLLAVFFFFAVVWSKVMQNFGTIPYRLYGQMGFISLFWICNWILELQKNLKFKYSLGIEWTKSSPSEMVGWWKTQRELVMRTYSPENQLYPGLLQKKCDQLVEGGDPSLLFSPLIWDATCSIAFSSGTCSTRKTLTC